MGFTDQETARLEALEPRPLAAAVDLGLGPADTATATGTVAAEDGAHLYRFTTEAAGRVRIEAAGDGLDPILRVFDDRGRCRGWNDDAGPDTDASALVLRRVRAGQTYYVAVGGADGTAGDYVLSVTSDPLDDCGNTAAEAGSVRMRGRTGWVRGAVQYAGDVDVRAFTAPEDGLATITQEVWSRWGSALEASLAVYDADGALLAEGETEADGDAALSLRVEAGQTYYVAFAGVGDSVGYYWGRVTTVPEPFASAEAVAPSGGGTVTLAGTIAEPGGAVAYRVAVPADGQMTFAAAGAEGLAPRLALYRSPDRVWMTSTASADGAAALRLGRVRVGQTFYLVVSGAAATTGDFTLTVASQPTDDHGDGLTTADRLRLRGGIRWARGRVNYADDVDVFELTAPATGTLTFAQTAWGRWGSLQGRLRVYDEAGNQLAADTDPTDGTRLTVGVVEGFRYYVEAGGHDGSTGLYGLRVTPTDGSAEVDHDPLAAATALDLAALGEVSAAGTIGRAGEFDVFSFTAEADGVVTVSLAADEAGLDAYLRAYDASGRLVGANNDAADGTSDARIALAVSAGQTYYLVASGAAWTTGAYTLTAISQPEDDYGNTLETSGRVRLDASGGLDAAFATIDYAGDVDVMA